VRDPESYTFYSRWFYDFLSRPDIVDKALAQLVGKSTLGRNLDRTTGDHVSGLPTGVASRHDADDQRYGQDPQRSVSRSASDLNDLGDGLIGYDIQAGIYSPDLVDMLTQISRNSKTNTPRTGCPI